MVYEFNRIRYCFVALVACVILSQVNAKELTDEQKEQIFTEVKKCANETGLSNDEFEAIIAKKELPTSEEGKCFLKCLMEKMDYFDESGKVNIISMQAAVDESMGDKKQAGDYKRFLQLCSESVTPDDTCAYSFAFTECMYNKMKDAGFSAPV